MNNEVYAGFISRANGEAKCGRCLESVTLDKRFCAPYDMHYCPHCGVRLNELIYVSNLKNIDGVSADYTESFKDEALALVGKDGDENG